MTPLKAQMWTDASITSVKVEDMRMACLATARNQLRGGPRSSASMSLAADLLLFVAMLMVCPASHGFATAAQQQPFSRVSDPDRVTICHVSHATCSSEFDSVRKNTDPVYENHTALAPVQNATKWAVGKRKSVKGRLTIRTNPSGAVIYANGRHIGRSPVLNHWHSSERPVEIEVHSDGFEVVRALIPLSQLRQGIRLFYEMKALPPVDHCTGEQGVTWIRAINANTVPFATLDRVRECFLNAEVWEGVEITSTALLRIRESSAYYYDRARARYMRSGVENFAICAEDIKRSLRSHGLDRCQRWKAQLLWVVCRKHYEDDIPPDTIETGERATEVLRRLQDSMDGTETSTLSQADASCYDHVVLRMKDLKLQVER